jgi:3'-phosphoadenosine 5'-phosphosulfate sulfotransferase (PAPS reductase)/FAD synthetase
MDEIKENLLVCTFSGGRTSAFMGLLLKDLPKYKGFDKVFIFANTGKEKEETLEFIDKCDKEWCLNIIWLEADVNIEKGVGTTFKIVDYKTASRGGKPFEDMLSKYPMPNNMASNCTRELKQRPIEKYVKSLGYKNVYTAMGIRFDERHRESNNAKEQNIIYPLIYDLQVDSRFIRNWWDRQSFDLNLKDYEGNCDLCFKKSLKKRLTIIKENPKSAEWWEKMEDKYSSEAIPRFDLRTNKSISELIQMSKKPFTRAEDLHELDKQQCDLFDFETDCFCKAN